VLQAYSVCRLVLSLPNTVQNDKLSLQGHGLT